MTKTPGLRAPQHVGRHVGRREGCWPDMQMCLVRVDATDCNAERLSAAGARAAQSRSQQVITASQPSLTDNRSSAVKFFHASPTLPRHVGQENLLEPVFCQRAAATSSMQPRWKE